MSSGCGVLVTFISVASTQVDRGSQREGHKPGVGIEVIEERVVGGAPALGGGGTSAGDEGRHSPNRPPRPARVGGALAEVGPAGLRTSSGSDRWRLGGRWGGRMPPIAPIRLE